MDKLTEDESAILDYLDDKTREIYDNAILVRQTGFRESREHAQNLIDVITKLARAIAPQLCGHPPGCVVSADEGTSYCGWCATEAHYSDQEDAIDAIEAECSALKKKLAAADETRTLLLKVLATLENEDGIAFDNLCERLDVPRQFLIDIGSIYDEGDGS